MTLFLTRTGYRAALACVLPLLVHAQVVGPADAGRVEERMQALPMPQKVVPETPAKALTSAGAPAGSESLRFQLKDIRIEGMTAFAPDSVRDIYAADLGKEITLDRIWLYANALTERYQQAGYFLSRAYVPAQEFGDGVVRIGVVEGTIGEVEVDPEWRDNSVVISISKQLQSYRPVTSGQVENSLLRLNDIPGASFRSVLGKIDAENAAAKTDPGAVKLKLISQKKRIQSQVGFDNFGSRYLGPYEASVSTQFSLAQNHQTNVTLLGATQLDELKFGSIRHTWMAWPDVTLDAGVSNTLSEPGYTLASQDIKSHSKGFSFGVSYPWIRQRDENLITRIGYESRDTRSSIFGFFPLTRDHVRALRLNTNYELADRWAGYDLMNVTLSQGVDGLGSSEAGDSSLSRSEAKPDFTKVEVTLSRLQALANSWNLLASANGQLASGPLYSSEEFGYGGQAFGRAFDSSEITGDHGIAGAVEIRYTGLPVWSGFSASPYGFYDIGSVWNDDAGGQQASGSSTGLGIRVAHELGATANLGVAFPLTREATAPIYSGNGNSPRYMMQVQMNF